MEDNLERESRGTSKMLSPRLSRRASPAIALLALFIAVLPLPLLTGYQPRADLFSNVQRLHVQIQPSTTVPFFDKVLPGQEDSRALLVSFPCPSGEELLIEFPPTMSIDEISSVMRAGALQNGPLQKDPPKGQRLRFREWATGRLGIALPYRYFLLAALLLAFTAGFLALSSTRARS